MRPEDIKAVKVIKLTPTWRGLVGMMLTAYAGDREEEEHHAELREEFYRMAEAADNWNAYVQESKGCSCGFDPDDPHMVGGCVCQEEEQ